MPHPAALDLEARLQARPDTPPTAPFDGGTGWCSELRRARFRRSLAGGQSLDHAEPAAGRVDGHQQRACHVGEGDHGLAGSEGG
jgi:hypothetical protein